MKHMGNVLLIYTGGTIGMMEDPHSGQLRPFNFSALTEQIPELKKLGVKLNAVSFQDRSEEHTSELQSH